MIGKQVLRTGITLLSVGALIVTGAAPAMAQDPDPGSRLTLSNYPTGIAIDSAGIVYVTSSGSAQVSVFDPGSTTRNESKTLTGVTSASDVEVNPVTGEVFVANSGANNVLVYDPGSTAPNPAKTRTGVVMPCGLAFRQLGGLLVGSCSTHAIYFYNAGALTPAFGFVSGVTNPSSLAVHPTTGELYVADYAGGVVKVFDRDTIVPNAAKTLTGLSSPHGIAFQPANGAVYVGNRGGTTASVFRLGETSASDSLAGLHLPYAVAVDPRTGRVFVAEDAGVEVYAAPSPAVTSVTPASGPVTGGTIVTIHASNLGLVNSVKFAGVAATIVGPPGYTSLQATTPSVSTAGPVTVDVATSTSTAGKVDAFTYTAVAPGKPADVTGVAGNAKVTVSWTAPAFTGGVPIESYTVTPTPSGTPCLTNATSCEVTGLTNGTAYQFTVLARNTAGLSTPSDVSAAVIPAIAVTLQVKAKAASYRPYRWGTTTLVKKATTPSEGTRVVTRKCTNPTGLSTRKLCTFTLLKKGKIKVRTKGYRGVEITISIQAVPKASAGPTYRPAKTWTRTWKVRR